MQEAIVLAGGFGTRLRAVVSDLPKPMAPVQGRPFLAYILDYLTAQGITTVILATGYKHQTITEYFGDSYHGLALAYSVENAPLGTGGAIREALAKTTGPEVYILNGDTFFGVNFAALQNSHHNKKADLTLSLKWEDKTDRYGRVVIKDHHVVGFQEKKAGVSGFINGGVYLANRDIFTELAFPEKFSFETDFLARYYQKRKFGVCITDGYFIDIGIPEDYRRAQTEMNALYE